MARYDWSKAVLLDRANVLWRIIFQTKQALSPAPYFGKIDKNTRTFWLNSKQYSGNTSLRSFSWQFLIAEKHEDFLFTSFISHIVIEYGRNIYQCPLRRIRLG